LDTRFFFISIILQTARFHKMKNIFTTKNAAISLHLFPETYLNPQQFSNIQIFADFHANCP